MLGVGRVAETLEQVIKRAGPILTPDNFQDCRFQVSVEWFRSIEASNGFFYRWLVVTNSAEGAEEQATKTRRPLAFVCLGLPTKRIGLAEEQ